MITDIIIIAWLGVIALIAWTGLRAFWRGVINHRKTSTQGDK